MIHVEHLFKNYGDLEVLKDISLDVKKGEVVSIIGPSGAGKSTFLRCINLLEVPTVGKLVVDGKTVEYKTNRSGNLTLMSKMKLTGLRTKVSMVFQQFNLWPTKTVLENVMEGPVIVKKMKKEEAKKLAMEQLEKVGLKEKANVLPLNLSGGQQQRVGIARALAMNPEVILFDEPTSALDPELVKEVLDLMVELAKSGMTMIVVTHEMNFARYVSNRTIFMEHGEILMDDASEKVFTSDHPRLQAFFHSITRDKEVQKKAEEKESLAAVI